MTEVRRRNKQNSVDDLRKTLLRLIELLEDQDEFEAVADLKIALHDVGVYPEGSLEFSKALGLIDEAFSGEHNLSAYTLQRKNREGQWGEVEELYLASTGVLNLVRRLRSVYV